MKRFEPSIKIAFDKLSGQILEAAQVFETGKEGFEIRRQSNQNEVELYCCECGQKLNVSTSKYDHLHFKHQPNAEYCILKDGNLTPGEIDEFSKILAAKESPRHKELKNKIAAKLVTVTEVESNSIAIDNKYIIYGQEKRRPDVYCKYRGHELVFEIQLSKLSQRYILYRDEFYKKHGIYLIWILDNFDIHNQGQLERDIKYLNKYENFFTLNEQIDGFQLICQYKFPFLTQNNKLLTEWQTQSVSLEQVNFDSESYQVFFSNFGDNKLKKIEEQNRRFSEFREAERKKIEDEKLSSAQFKADNIIDRIKSLRKHKVQVFNSAITLIKELDEYELKELNRRLNLSGRNNLKLPALNKWIYEAKQEDVAFINFILRCGEIDIDVNEVTTDGITAFQEIYRNTQIFKDEPIKALFKRGYRLSKTDETYLNSLPQDNKLENDRILYSLWQNLTNKDLVDDVFKFDKLLFIIESARKKEIVGFNLKAHGWIAFANNTIAYRGEYWDYIELAFRFYGLWDMLKELDKKKTFERKLQELHKNKPMQKFDFDRVFRDLYPALAYSHNPYPF